MHIWESRVLHISRPLLTSPHTSIRRTRLPIMQPFTSLFSRFKAAKQKASASTQKTPPTNPRYSRHHRQVCGDFSSLTGTLLLPALKGITLQGTYIRRSARPCEPLPSQEPLHSMPERYLEPRILPWPLAAPASNLSTLGVGSASPRLAHYDRKLRSLGQTETFDHRVPP